MAPRSSKKKQQYQDLLFVAAAHVLPAVVLRSAPDATEAELVDTAVLLARGLLAELGYSFSQLEAGNDSV